MLNALCFVCLKDHGGDAQGLPDRPEQHQQRDQDAAGAVDRHERAPQEPPVSARRAEPVRR